MAGRKFIEKPPDIIERVVEESLKIIGIEDIEEGKIKLLSRLIMSGLAYHYFNSPDDLIKMGFLQFEKSPDKDELFKITLLRDREAGVINADTLWKYYKGELHQEAKFKEILDNFLEGLITYSQEQEVNITKLTSTIQKKRRN
jgi:hypothetical protein